MGVKISELPRTQSANSNDNLIINQASQTKQITVEKLIESYLSNASYVTEEGLDNYLSAHIMDYLSETLGEYVTENGLSEALSDYMTSGEIASYLSEQLGGYVPGSYLSEPIDSYLSNVGVVTNDNFSDALALYLSVYGGQMIYDAISQYINP